jgi:hypothetical protein
MAAFLVYTGMDKLLERLERNSLVLPALIIAVAMVAAAWISDRSGRYQPMPQEGRGVSVIDTKSGDVYTQTSTVRRGKRVWRRGGPRRAIIDNE